MSKTKTAMKVGASIGAIGLAISAMTGAFGAWTDSQTFEQTVTAGVVDIGSAAVAGTPTTALTTTFGPFAPSDTGFRLVTLTNTNANALPLANVRVGAAIGAITDSFGSPDATAAELGGAISVVVNQCTTAYSDAGVCSGTETAGVVTTTTVFSLSTPVTLGAGTMAAAATHHYKVLYTVSADPAASVQGASAPVTWTFYADPRAAVTNR